jgi:hypothetical protein
MFGVCAGEGIKARGVEGFRIRLGLGYYVTLKHSCSRDHTVLKMEILDLD